MLTWRLPTLFPPGRFVRVTLTGGNLKQSGQIVTWNDAGYYEVALDAGSLTITVVQRREFRTSPGIPPSAAPLPRGRCSIGVVEFRAAWELAPDRQFVPCSIKSRFPSPKT